MLEAEIANDRPVKALAQVVGMSPFQLNRAFDAVHGRTIPAYLRRLRMVKAAHLLVTTTMMVAEVRMAVGYSNSSAFIRAFEAEIGEGPSEYRNRERAAGRAVAPVPRGGHDA